MAKVKDFQFEDCFDPSSKMRYQGDAINAVLNLFDGVSKDIGGVTQLGRAKLGTGFEGDPHRNPHLVTGSRLLKNLNEVQLKNNIFPDSDLKGANFCVEMETGTGKTYVYLRTIMELYKTYKITKFIIVVPSVAIRKGVEKSIKQLEASFAAWYDEIRLSDHFFVFDSNCPVGTVSSKLVESSDLSIMLTTMQSIAGDNKRLKGGGEVSRAAGEKINVWDDISYIKPVVIVDEPQRVMGTKKATKASEAIDEVKPSFSLHYSATPPKNKFCTVYRLSSFDAFEKELVKSIEVKTIFGQVPKDFAYIRFVDVGDDLKAKIEIFKTEQGSAWSKLVMVSVGKDSSLYQLSGKMPQYKNTYIYENPHKKKPLRIMQDGDVIELTAGESTYKQDAENAKRIQMRIMLKSHFDKQFEFLAAGERIKVLSLFFIDSVAKVRDNTQADGRGEYLRLFDEEYNKLINSAAYRPLFEKYAEFFPHYKNTLQVREGYFAKDKAGNVVDLNDISATDDEDVKFDKKSQEDIDRGIQDILDGKERVIQFDNPLAFIFSHSALREGWDNPNVFTLCMFKTGNSEIAKKQEIGRGLRLCLTDEFKRIYDSNINRLTVVVNDSYESVAASIQQDFNEKAGFNKDEVTFEVLLSTLKTAGVPKAKIDATLVEAFRTELLMGGIINDKSIIKPKADITKVNFTNETLKEHATKICEKFNKIVAERGTKKIKVTNGDVEPPKNERQAYMSEPQFQAIMNELHSKIKQRTYYQVNIDNDAFIKNTTATLNSEFGDKSITRTYNIGTGGLAVNKTNKAFKMTDGVITQQSEDVDDQEKKSEYEIINYIMYHTNLPRLAIARILKGFNNREILNSQDWLDRVTWRTNELLTIAKGGGGIKYNIIDGYEFDQSYIFEADTVEDEAELDAVKKKILTTSTAKRRAIHKYYKMDGTGEYDFGAALEQQDGILLWTKLKKSRFVIETPYGGYTPDWAVVARGKDGKPHLYFIVETKMDKEWEDLQEEEKSKINCAKSHFAALGTIDASEWVNAFAGKTDSFMEKLAKRFKISEA